MKDQRYQVIVGDQVKEYEKGTTFLSIAKDFKEQYDCAIVLVIVDQKLQELHKRLTNPCTLKFLTLKDNIGHKAYRRSACFLLIKAFYDILGHDERKKIKVEFSLGSGYYCSVRGEICLNEKILGKIKKRMLELVEMDIPILKKSCQKDEAIKKFHQYGMSDKERLFQYRRGSEVNLYSINNFEDYFYGFMVPSTGYLQYFELYLYDTGLILQLPSRQEPNIIPPFRPSAQLFATMKESGQWGESLGIDTVGALNDAICKGEIKDMILVQEALQESKIASIAADIIRQGNKKFVMVAGPSSSGKTTFSHRLSIQLRAQGMHPHPIAVDDYFVDREQTPKDEYGNYNFECLEAIDRVKFNEDMTALLKGEEVELPFFNFKTGKREYNGKVKTLGKEDILIIEGIHGLNDALSYSLPRESKYKIYISALTQLNVDEHNRIPTTDGRLIRRMVRDYRTRGSSAKRTLSMWESVRRGEEENIFPFQEEADAMFNSALVYELAVLKQFIEPLLFGIPKGDPEFLEAKRLLKFMEYFLGISSEDVPHNSILREFVGGSCFQV